MKQKPIKKAWKVWCWSDDEYTQYYSKKDPIYAETRDKARQCYEQGEETRSFVEIKAIRWQEKDLYEYQGKLVTTSRIEQLQEIEKRNKKLQELPEGLYYIQNGYCGNSIIFWGKNNCGYTTNLANAGKYTKEEVLKIAVDGREEDKIWPAEEIESHIISVVDSQYLNHKLRI